MAPTNVLCVVKLPRVSGVPRDVVENTFAFTKAGSTDIDLAQLGTQLQKFYNRDNSITGGTRKVAQYINETVSRALPTHIEMYDIDVPGPPIHDTTFTLAAVLSGSESSCLPDACAMGVTIHADLSTVSEHSGATRPRARRRGRFFVGPLIAAEMVDTTSGVPRIGSGPRDTAGFSIVNTMGDCFDFAGAQLCVWSRVDHALRPVVGVWIDNRFDTQRRREEEASSRSVYLGA